MSKSALSASPVQSRSHRAQSRSHRSECSPAGRVTRSLLGWGVVAGPFYIVVSLLEATLRPGFDLGRHSWSLMANGEFGWAHSAVLVITGLMVIAAAIGIGRALHVRTAAVLLAAFGAGQIGAGFFTADPADGFPVGTPAGAGEITWHGLLHLVCGGLGFLAFTAATIVLGVRFLRHREPGWGVFSIATGVLFIAAFGGIASGGAGPMVIAFIFAVVLAFAWLGLTCIRLYRRVS
ncbi:DUF998 domain-containing protein [Microbacterium pumilum]|uniref:DUF998 domain-containing protein n=1 Tax=Microbacterium pumilum TaxID=344165 RepID=A0ABP5E901_9MICO